MSKARTENSLRVVAGGQGGEPEATSGSKHPLETTGFVGRVRELSGVEGLLGLTRLLTLVRVGGSGRTRLALRIATRIFEGHVWWVELASLADPDPVEARVASTLGVVGAPSHGVLPLILKLGIATEEEVKIDTMAQRLRADVVASGGVIKTPELAGAWTRKRRTTGLATRAGIQDPGPSLRRSYSYYEALSLLSKRSIRLWRFLWAFS